MKVITAAVGTPEWHEARRVGLGGSEVAAAIGLSPWCSPFTLWHRKRGGVGPGEESQPMYWGKLLEPVLRGEHDRRGGQMVHIFGRQHVVDDWRIASPDGEILDPDARVGRLWEGKTADKNDSYDWAEDGSVDPAAIPPYYRVQCLWYMDVLNVHRLTLSVLIGGNDYREYDVPWDAAEAELIRSKAEAFWLTVVNGQRPSLDDSMSTYETVRALHPDIDGEDVEIPAPVGDEYLASDLDLKDSKKRAQIAKTTLLDHMGTARRALVAGDPIARRQPGRGESVSLYPIHPKEAA